MVVTLEVAARSRLLEMFAIEVLQVVEELRLMSVMAETHHSYTTVTPQSVMAAAPRRSDRIQNARFSISPSRA